MNEIDPKIFLSQGYFLNIRIESLKKELELLRSAVDIGSPRLDPIGGTPGNNWSGKNAQIQTVEKIIDLEKDIEKEIASLIVVSRRIHEVINQVEDPREQIVLRLRYIFNKSMAEIAEDLDLSPKQLKIVFLRSVQSVKTILEKDYDFQNT